MPKYLTIGDIGPSGDSHLSRTDAKVLGSASKVAELARLRHLDPPFDVAFAVAAPSPRKVGPIDLGPNRRRGSRHMSVSTKATRGAVSLCLG